jgi:hypothetical protein
MLVSHHQNAEKESWRKDSKHLLKMWHSWNILERY